jgi:hypothetical protein
MRVPTGWTTRESMRAEAAPAATWRASIEVAEEPTRCRGGVRSACVRPSDGGGIGHLAEEDKATRGQHRA